jgi:hypothetical protein
MLLITLINTHRYTGCSVAAPPGLVDWWYIWKLDDEKTGGIAKTTHLGVKEGNVQSHKTP